MSDVMMMCGHAAHGKNAQGEPVCVICIGIREGATEVAETPDLTGRTARCSYGPHADRPSEVTLAFFEHRPDQEFDSYYCGCCGWD